jgi:uncharacterized membrane protein AbrB (regulator of aidB expression)
MPQGSAAVKSGAVTMHYFNLIKDELPKTLLQVVISAIGFLIALAINSALTNRSERQAFDA